MWAARGGKAGREGQKIPSALERGPTPVEPAPRGCDWQRGPTGSGPSRQAESGSFDRRSWQAAKAAGLYRVAERASPPSPPFAIGAAPAIGRQPRPLTPAGPPEWNPGSSAGITVH